MKPHKRINFLNEQFRSGADTSVGIDALLDRAALATFLVMILFAGHVLYKNSQQGENVKRLTATKTMLDAELTKLEASAGSISDLSRDLSPLKSVIRNKILWTDAFKELTSIISSDVWLESMTSSYADNSRSFLMTGFAVSQEKVTEFFENLENSFYFRDIMIRYSERKTEFSPALYEFQFSTLIPSKNLSVSQK